jgi:hypothetical protein
MHILNQQNPTTCYSYITALSPIPSPALAHERGGVFAVQPEVVKRHLKSSSLVFYCTPASGEGEEQGRGKKKNPVILLYM